MFRDLVNSFNSARKVQPSEASTRSTEDICFVNNYADKTTTFDMDKQHLGRTESAQMRDTYLGRSSKSAVVSHKSTAKLQQSAYDPERQPFCPVYLNQQWVTQFFMCFYPSSCSCSCSCSLSLARSWQCPIRKRIVRLSRIALMNRLNHLTKSPFFIY